MVIRYFDKDGKEHRLNIKTNQPIFIASEIGNTGEYAEFRVDEATEYNKALGGYSTAGKFNISMASNHGMTLYPVSNGEIRLGPSIK